MTCPSCGSQTSRETCEACGWRPGRNEAAVPARPYWEIVRCTYESQSGRCYLAAGTTEYARCGWHRRDGVRHDDRAAFLAWLEQFRPGGTYGTVRHQFWRHEDLLWDAVQGIAKLPTCTRAWDVEIQRRHSEIFWALRGDKRPWPGDCGRLTGLPGWDWSLDRDFPRLAEIGRRLRDEAEQGRTQRCMRKSGFTAVEETVGAIVGTHA